MSYSNTWNEPFLPWVDSENDRRFRRMLIASILIFSVIGLIISYIPVPEVEQKELKDVSPRLAKLILEKKRQPPPPPPPKAETKKKKDAKKKPAEKKPEPKKQESARKKAEKAGLVALSDELADLRESFDMASLQDNKLQQKVGKQAAPVTTASAVLTAKAGSGSGGINTGSLSRTTGGNELASRSTTSVTSSIGSRSSSNTTRSGNSRQAARGAEEIERVFQQNKGAIFTLYNRALRKDPSLQGKVVLELTIAPNGKVVKCRILSSELNDPNLEGKLVSRIKLFRFAAKDVEQITVTYPIDFLPS